MSKLTGGRVSYYLADVPYPQREDQPPYRAECEDIIEVLQMTPDEANIFKEIWRSASARLHNGKPGHTALYGAEKMVHYATRILRRKRREADAEAQYIPDEQSGAADTAPTPDQQRAVPFAAQFPEIRRAGVS